ncbi:MAG: hypothetical protein U0232_34085, partial [Thermomicrobiales bacterium]
SDGTLVAQESGACPSDTTSIPVGEEIRCWGESGLQKIATAIAGIGRPGPTPSPLLSSNTPKPVVFPSMPGGTGAEAVLRFRQVATRGSMSCAVLVGGAVWCWGFDLFQITRLTERVLQQPTAVPGLAGVAEIALSENALCARTESGGVRCQGAGVIGPWVAMLPDSDPAVELVAGKDHHCARLQSGGVRCWGYNTYGELGSGATRTYFDREAPLDVVAGLSDAVQIAAGDEHSCAIVGTNHEVRCWGRNDRGQLGDGTEANRLRPVPVLEHPAAVGVVETRLTNVAQLVAGGGHTCARLSNNEVRCWGSNSKGQLGNGEAGATLRSTAPVAVRNSGSDASNLGGVVEVVAGAEHTCARLLNNEIRCWGANAEGQLGDRTNENRSAPSGSALCCAETSTACAAGCVNTQTDNRHCGNCATSCSGSQQCVGGRCLSATT